MARRRRKRCSSSCEWDGRSYDSWGRRGSGSASLERVGEEKGGRGMLAKDRERSPHREKERERLAEMARQALQNNNIAAFTKEVEARTGQVPAPVDDAEVKAGDENAMRGRVEV